MTSDNNVASEALQFVAFNIGEEEFSVPILNVQEIIRMSEITRVPHTSDFVGGVINLRGRVIPIVDLRSRFGIQRLEKKSSRERVVVINSEERVVGLVVDSVSEILHMDASIIEAPPDFRGTVSSDYINGVGKLKDRLIVLLNLEKVLNEGNAESIGHLADGSRERSCFMN